MESCLLIYGDSGNGKTYASRILSTKLGIVQIEFDNIINFFTELTRLKIGESEPGFDFKKWFIQRLPFNSEEDFVGFKNACDVLISKQLKFFEEFYAKLILNKKSTSHYRTDELKNCVDLGKNGEFLEQLANEITDIMLKYIIKQNESAILEGVYFKEGHYREAIIEKCRKAHFLECKYKNRNDEFIYILNGKGIRDILELQSHVKKLLKTKRPSYQIFSEKGLGDSKSIEKLSKLGIPERLENKKVLDLGCNEGFYCFECERRGAKCLGIEKDPYWYNEAIKRKNEFSSFVNFINQSWDWLPLLNYKFDIVLFLAAFHYIKDNQLEVLTNIYNKLNDNGMLILEIGVLDKNNNEFLVENVKRPAGDICQFTNKFTIEKLLKDAGFNEITYHGPGWNIKGDNVPRYVIHAFKNDKKKNITNSKIPQKDKNDLNLEAEIPVSSQEIGDLLINAYNKNALYRIIISLGYKLLKKK